MMMSLVKRYTRFEDRYWYQPSLTWLSILLLPCAWMYGAMVALRRFAYRVHLLKSYTFPVPVIVVGNIAVGGTGKTPCVVALAKYFQSQGWEVGIVSRGYGGIRQQDPCFVTASSRVSEVGDEPLLMARHADCPVVVGVDRVAAVALLLKQFPACKIVLSDDGLQHYRLQRQVEIVVIDAERGLGNGRLLPSGPLRESKQRLAEVAFLLANGGSFAGAYTFTLQPDTLYSLRDNKPCANMEAMKSTPIHAIAGIGNPGRFFATLRAMGFDVREHSFSDHHHFSKKDLIFNDNLPVVMTEKDAVKCEVFAGDNMWYLPVTAQLDPEFLQALAEKI